MSSCRTMALKCGKVHYSRSFNSLLHCALKNACLHKMERNTRRFGMERIIWKNETETKMYMSIVNGIILLWNAMVHFTSFFLYDLSKYTRIVHTYCRRMFTIIRVSSNTLMNLLIPYSMLLSRLTYIAHVGYLYP